MFHRCSILLPDKFGRGAATVTDAAGIYVSGKLHLAKPAGSLVAGQEFVDGIAHVPVMTIHRFGSSRCKRKNEFLALQFVARIAVGETVLKSLFHPTFQYRRCGIPENGKLQNDDVGAEQSSLFGFHVDLKSG